MQADSFVPPSLDTKKVGLGSFVNPAWFKDITSSAVWIRGYVTKRISNDTQVVWPVVVELPNCRAVFVRGEVSYLDPLSVRLDPATDMDLTVHRELKWILTPPGIYLLLLAPYKVDGVDRADAEVMDEIGAGVGLLNSSSGHNIAYRKLFDNVMSADGTQASVYSDVVINPLTSPAPDILPSGVLRLELVANAINAQLGPDRRRINLSLRWFEKAVVAGSGVDAFLSLWIAIETLGMPDTTDIRPLNEALSRAYGRPREEVTSIFLIGRLFGLRSLIVHNGATPPFHWKLLDYGSAIYRDLLLETLALPSERCAEAVLSAEGSTIRQALEVALAAV